MARKIRFLIIDTKVAADGAIVDFGAMVCDRQGNITGDFAVLVANEPKGRQSTNYDVDAKLGTKLELLDVHQRQDYERMLGDGSRRLASIAEINHWLTRIYATFNYPILAAYNLSYELDKLKKMGIDVSEFVERICIRDAADTFFAESKKFKTFTNDNLLGTHPPVSNLHTMASFASGKILPPESNKAIEDLMTYALPTLTAIVNQRQWRTRCAEVGSKITQS